MKKNKVFKISRRQFIKISGLGASGLMLGIGCSSSMTKNADTEEDFSPNIYLHMLSDGQVIIIAHRSEMGTGIRTSLPMVMADELEADWSLVKLEQATGDEKYGNQNTDGSFSMRMFYPQFRLLGATACLMLRKAAAAKWDIDYTECRAEKHFIFDSNGNKLFYGDLVEKAAKLPVPDAIDVVLKPERNFNYIKHKTSLYDLKDYVTGTTKYSMDLDIPNAKYAVVSRNPEAGSGVKSFNADEALKIPGVLKIFKLESPGFPTSFDKALGGIVVIADDTWTALKARKALQIEWETGSNANYDTEEFMNEMAITAKKEGVIRRSAGDIKHAMQTAKRVIKAEFRIPHYAHANMEPPCAVANYDDGKCEIWAPTQSPQWARSAVAKALGLKTGDVTLNVSFLGSAFGRKSKPDFVVEAALISKEAGMPIKLFYSREDDLQYDFYHSNSVQYLEAAIDDKNRVNGWMHRSIFPPIGGTSDINNDTPSAGSLSQGMVDVPFDIENLSCETNKAKAQIRIGWLRSVNNIHHAFAIGSFLDILAQERGKDAIENALELIGDNRNIGFDKLIDGFSNYGESIDAYPWDTSRLIGVIKTVREKSGWEAELTSNEGIGFAAHRSFLTYVACVVKVVFDAENTIHIPEVHYAVDCGVSVNPDRIKAQFEGGAVFGISLLNTEISVTNGRVNQSNFHNYKLARIKDAPDKTFVHIIDSEEKPTGVGEPPVPPLLPALCNAIYKVSGKRIYNLPYKL